MNQPGVKLAREFYARSTVVVARELLGKTIVRARPNGELVGGVVVETEAYLPNDRACHGFRGRTKRNASMFGTPGHAYVYLIYGLHHCVNVVTETESVAGAVLIRAIEPWPNTDRGRGPGLTCRALEIDRSLDGIDLTGDTLWFEDRGLVAPDALIARGPRVGVGYAGEWAAAPLRFWWRDNPHVSGRQRETVALTPPS